MEEIKIEYYDSLHFDNVTRHGCRHKVKMQEDTLQGSKGLLAKGTYERQAYKVAQ
jgi:hypothetical protein